MKLFLAETLEPFRAISVNKRSRAFKERVACYALHALRAICILFPRIRAEAAQSRGVKGTDSSRLRRNLFSDTRHRYTRINGGTATLENPGEIERTVRKSTSSGPRNVLGTPRLPAKEASRQRGEERSLLSGWPRRVC